MDRLVVILLIAIDRLGTLVQITQSEAVVGVTDLFMSRMKLGKGQVVLRGEKIVFLVKIIVRDLQIGLEGGLAPSEARFKYFKTLNRFFMFPLFGVGVALLGGLFAGGRP